MVTTYKHLHIKAVGGAAGDMILAALLDVGARRDAIERAFAGLGIPGLQLQVDRMQTHDVEGYHVRSIAPKTHHHHHSRDDIRKIIERCDCTENAKKWATTVFDILIRAEATVHGTVPDSVHLHEVGELDSVMDVLGIAVAYDSLGTPTVSVEALPSGSGKVQCAHGWLECPVPAVIEIVKESSLCLEPAPILGETVTPTGAAVLAALCSTKTTPPDRQKANALGMGIGTRVFDDRPNTLCIHAYI
jgi:pyridinium-3,5-bisthiocarboxylic acid mononucleotide nickel chelatase